MFYYYYLPSNATSVPKAPRLASRRYRNGEGYPLSSKLGGLGSAVSSPSEVRGTARDEIEFYTIRMPERPSSGMFCTEFHIKQ